VKDNAGGSGKDDNVGGQDSNKGKDVAVKEEPKAKTNDFFKNLFAKMAKLIIVLFLAAVIAIASAQYLVGGYRPAVAYAGGYAARPVVAGYGGYAAYPTYGRAIYG